MIGARRIERHAGNARRALGDAVTVGERQAEFFFDAGLQVGIERRTGNADMRSAPRSSFLRPATVLYSSNR